LREVQPSNIKRLESFEVYSGKLWELRKRLKQITK